MLWEDTCFMYIGRNEITSNFFNTIVLTWIYYGTHCFSLFPLTSGQLRLQMI